LFGVNNNRVDLRMVHTLVIDLGMMLNAFCGS
jgi:hypothetical protein